LSNYQQATVEKAKESADYASVPIINCYLLDSGGLKRHASMWLQCRCIKPYKEDV